MKLTGDRTAIDHNERRIQIKKIPQPNPAKQKLEELLAQVEGVTWDWEQDDRDYIISPLFKDDDHANDPEKLGDLRKALQKIAAQIEEVGFFESKYEWEGQVRFWPYLLLDQMSYDPYKGIPDPKDLFE